MSDLDTLRDAFDQLGIEYHAKSRMPPLGSNEQVVTTILTVGFRVEFSFDLTGQLLSCMYQPPLNLGVTEGAIALRDRLNAWIDGAKLIPAFPLNEVRRGTANAEIVVDSLDVGAGNPFTSPDGSREAAERWKKRVGEKS